MRKVVLALLLASAACPALAQTQNLVAPPVEQVGQRLDAATFAAVGTNWNTVNTQSTATVTPPSGQYVYITAMYMQACQDATGAAATNVGWSTTGLGSGATASPQFSISQASSAGSCAGSPGMVTFATPLKSNAPGTNVTLVSPSAIGHTGFSSEIFGYFSN